VILIDAGYGPVYSVILIDAGYGPVYNELERLMLGMDQRIVGDID